MEKKLRKCILCSVHCKHLSQFIHNWPPGLPHHCHGCGLCEHTSSVQLLWWAYYNYIYQNSQNLILCLCCPQFLAFTLAVTSSSPLQKCPHYENRTQGAKGTKTDWHFDYFCCISNLWLAPLAATLKAFYKGSGKDPLPPSYMMDHKIVEFLSPPSLNLRLDPSITEAWGSSCRSKKANEWIFDGME